MFKNLQDKFFKWLARRVIVHNGKREMTLNEAIKASRQGNDERMMVITTKAVALHQAVQCEDWEWATRLYRTMTKKLRTFASVNPKYSEGIDQFLQNGCQPLMECIATSDRYGFNDHWLTFQQQIDLWHEHYKLADITVVLPN